MTYCESIVFLPNVLKFVAEIKVSNLSLVFGNLLSTLGWGWGVFRFYHLKGGVEGLLTWYYLPKNYPHKGRSDKNT